MFQRGTLEVQALINVRPAKLWKKEEEENVSLLESNKKLEWRAVMHSCLWKMRASTCSQNGRDDESSCTHSTGIQAQSAGPTGCGGASEPQFD